MPSQEYYDGRLMESNVILHAHLVKCLNFDIIEVRGENSTKGDVVGIVAGEETPISIKHATKTHTQVHLPTLRSFTKAMNTPSNVVLLLEQWLGVVNQTQFESWLSGKQPTKQQKKYKRLFAEDITDWDIVVKWFNDNRRPLAELLIQSMNGEKPAKYLVWVDKKTKAYQVVDIQTLVDWIETDCVWVTGPRNGGSTLRCEYKGKPIFHLQMKGSGGAGNEYNHNPQFQIHTHWPEKTIVHRGVVGGINT